MTSATMSAMKAAMIPVTMAVMTAAMTIVTMAAMTGTIIATATMTSTDIKCNYN